MKPARFYQLFGLVVRSELALPFPSSEDSQPADVEVRFGTLPASSGWIHCDGDDGLCFEVPEIGRYRISGGREIIVDPAGNATGSEVRLYLLGSAFGALLHQRGLVPLHANAVLIRGCAVAFAGRSGAGKSSLAAWFFDRGYPVLTDDVCAIHLDGGGPAVMPGLPRLRLTTEAAQRHDRTRQRTSFEEDAKIEVPVPDPGFDTAPPLVACYLLEDEGHDATVRIRPLTGVDAIEVLVANTYRGRVVGLINGTHRHLTACAEIAKHVKIWRASRRKSEPHFDQVAGQLERHALSVVEGLDRQTIETRFPAAHLRA